MSVRSTLKLAAIFEGATGVALAVVPEAVIRLLLGPRVGEGAGAIGRVTGLALISLGLACWPGRDPSAGLRSDLRAMLAYNFLVASYLAYMGVLAESVGALLWPAVVVHAAITVLLVRGRLLVIDEIAVLGRTANDRRGTSVSPHV
jgi:hypothetical protein